LITKNASKYILKGKQNAKTDTIDRAKIKNNTGIPESKHYQEALNIYYKLLYKKNILKDQINTL
jgi:hypothetical protein